jgi:asparagine synthase (glutamine-hydrolysing)
MSLKFFDKLSGKMKSGMNPFDHWMSENASLKNYIETYFSDHIHLLNQYDSLQKNCTKLFNRGNSGEKFQVITLLAAIKLHFKDDN